MATCIRDGHLYRRHNYKPNAATRTLRCKGCGKEKHYSTGEPRKRRGPSLREHIDQGLIERGAHG